MTARDLEWFTLWQLNPHASMAAVPVFLSLVCCCVFVAMCATLVLATFALGGFSRRRLEATMRWAGDAKSSPPTRLNSNFFVAFFSMNYKVCTE